MTIMTDVGFCRYYAISQPLKAKYLCTSHHARAVILSIWFASCLLSLPSIFVQVMRLLMWNRQLILHYLDN